MRIGIDCRLSGKKHAGIGRYIEHLVTQLVNETRYSWVLFFSSNDQVKEIFPDTIPKHIIVVYIPVKHYTVLEQLVLPWYFYKAKLDLLHVPHFNIPILYLKQIVVTIHDLLWHTQRGSHVTTLPPLMYWFKYLFYRLITRISVSRATYILVPSETIKQTILSFYTFAKNKIYITKEGVSLAQLPIVTPKTLQKKLATYKPFLLYVGSLYPHKNVPLLLEVLRKKEDISLVIAGSRSVFQNDIEKLIKTYNLESRVLLTGYLSDQELAYTYKHALALVQPSFSEGFGLTGIEALSLQTPVLASNIPIFKEIYKEYALYFDPTSVDSCIAAIENLQSKQPLQLADVSKSISNEYSWKKMATQTLEVYSSALNQK